MDRGVWQATIHGVTRVRHNLVTKPLPPSESKFRPQSKVFCIGYTICNMWVCTAAVVLSLVMVSDKLHSGSTPLMSLVNLDKLFNMSFSFFFC